MSSLKSGDPCPREACTGKMVCYSTKVIESENVRKRYHHCDKCGCRPVNNTATIPLEFAPPRRKRA